MKPQCAFFNFTVQNNADEVDVHIDGYIVDSPTQELMREYWGDETSVSYKSFRNQVEKAAPKTLNVYINSGGGHVGDAMAMHDYMQDLEKKGVRVNRFGRGIIASAATYLLMGNNSEMSENSFLMIHNVSMVAFGDINQVENQARAGRKFNDRIRDFYANETDNPPETIAGWMNKETWMTAAEAKERKFVKNISGKAEFTNTIRAEHWPFANTAVLNTYNSFTQKHSDMDLSKIKDAIKNALKELGFSKPEDDARLNTATEAISSALAEQLKPFENLNETIQNAVTEALKDVAPERIAETVRNQVTEAVKPFATKEEVTALQNSVAEKLGGKPAGEKDDDSEDSRDRKVKNKKSFYGGVGSFEKN